jgi:hypothetical protein
MYLFTYLFVCFFIIYLFIFRLFNDAVSTLTIYR